MSTKEIVSEIRQKLNELARERQELVARLEEIDEVFQVLGVDPGRGGRGAQRQNGQRRGRSRGRGRGMRPGGQRVQGVKQTLLETLSSTPQSPAELKAAVSRKLGQDVAITTQLAILKREKLAKAVGRGQWVRA